MDARAQRACPVYPPEMRSISGEGR